MLILERKQGESVVVYDTVTGEKIGEIICHRISDETDLMNGRVKLGFDFSKKYQIDREELYLAKLKTPKNPNNCVTGEFHE